MKQRELRQGKSHTRRNLADKIRLDVIPMPRKLVREFGKAALNAFGVYDSENDAFYPYRFLGTLKSVTLR